MFNKVTAGIYAALGHLFFALIILSMAMPLFFVGLNDEYFVLYLSLIIVITFPVLDYFYVFLERVVLIQPDKIISPEKIDLVLESQTPSRLVNDGFEQILSAFSVRSGKIIIYNKGSDSYDIYEQNGIKKRVVQNALIDRDNPLFRNFIHQNAIVYRKRLNPEIGYEKKVIEEMTRLGGEIAIPIFYYERFLGVLVLGERRMRYSADDISLLSTFASKIGILFVNSFLWKESLSKSDIKREYEMGLKVQRSFNSPCNTRIGNVEYSVYVKEGEETRYFHCIFSTENGIHISAYEQTGSYQGAFVFSPILIPVSQTYARMGYSPGDVVEKTEWVIAEKTLVEGSFPIIHIAIDQSFKWSRKGFPSVFRYDAEQEEATFLNDTESDAGVPCMGGMVFIVFDESFVKTMGHHYEAIVSILESYAGAPLSAIRTLLSEKIIEHGGNPDFFLMLRILQ